MPLLVSYFVGLLFSCAFFWLGRILYAKNERLGKNYFWAPEFVKSYFRWAGMFFMVLSGASVAVLSAALLLRLI